jgi:hypothetical protein
LHNADAVKFCLAHGRAPDGPNVPTPDVAVSRRCRCADVR